jgi:hypothetical protein
MPRFELETLACLVYPHKYNALPLSYTGPLRMNYGNLLTKDIYISMIQNGHLTLFVCFEFTIGPFTVEKSKFHKDKVARA